MIDAFGAIYVIGGITGRDDTYLNDVWASTNGGARTGLSRQGGGRGVLEGVLNGVL